MIFVAAGTQDARQIIEQLLHEGHTVTASVVSDYGKILLRHHSHLTVIEQALDETELQKKLKDITADIFIDASHPYAVNISQTAMNVCAQLKIHYIRYERPTIALPIYDKLYTTASFAEAAQKAFELGNNVFLTTGSRHLSEFTALLNNKNQILTARILPVVESIQACMAVGILPKHIIAMQGPFSIGLNKAMYEQTGAQVVVMKNSGKLGGSDTKLTAAIKAGIFAVVIDRPPINYKNICTNYSAVNREIKKFYRNY
ncbi:precorrin-6A reductase [Pectinatus frisingensis]|jgi:precorrin-6A/cobalt-precorrin-6A reductase|uniref:precorrin-6A reductase n=1 Tax=Pectinatus frisingensis TaxID=865 RepID=UPI0015F704EC|nr:precorrin-6A reductase [Pectinatus frisingensis]